MGVPLKPFDASGAFAARVPGEAKGLRRAAVRSAGATILSGAAGISIQIVSASVLARILSPRDFGLVTMVTTFSLLLMNGPANGFYDALIQRKEVTHALASTLFWINTVVVALLSLGFVAAGPLLARLFGEPEVAPIATGFSIAIFITGLPSIHSALLRRGMRFSALAKNDLVARGAGVLTSMAFGMAGWGYRALVIGAFVLALSTAVGVWILCPWRPGLPRRRAGTRSALVFAGHIAARYTFNYVARNSDNLLVGWRFGAHALGFYKKAYDLFTLPLFQLINNNANVAVSALSRVREDRAQYLRFVVGAIGVTAFIGMGLAGDLTLISKDLIRVLLGPGWDTAGNIYMFFAPAVGIMMVNGIHGWLHVSAGRADRFLVWGIVEWMVTVTLFFAGLHWGPQGVAVAWGVSFWTLTLPAMAYAGKPVGLKMSPVFGAIWRYVIAALAAGFAVFFALQRVSWLHGASGISGAFSRIMLDTALFTVLYLGAVVLLHGSTAPIRRVGKLLRELRSRKAARAAVSA